MSAKLRQDGVLVKGPNFPLFVSDDFVEAGLPIPTASTRDGRHTRKLSKPSPLPLTTPASTWKEKPEVRAWLNGEVVEEDTRDTPKRFSPIKRL